MTEAIQQFYFADEGSATFAIIKECLAKSDKAWAARHKLVKQALGLKRLSKDVRIVYWGESRWGVQPPEGMEMPQPWKLKRLKGSYESYWGPNLSTKEGKALRKDIESDAYRVATSTSVSRAAGIAPVFVGMTMYSAGFVPVKGGCIIRAVKGHKIPKDCTRISDIEADQLENAPKRRTSNRRAARTE